MGIPPLLKLNTLQCHSPDRARRLRLGSLGRGAIRLARGWDDESLPSRPRFINGGRSKRRTRARAHGGASHLRKSRN